MYLPAVPSKVENFQTHLASYSYVTSPSKIQERLSSNLAARKFAVKLQTYSHMRAEDIRTLCERPGVFSRIFNEDLKRAFDNCTS